ncbi:MAG: cysteine desulfurase family protein [Acidobacteriota bacterium]
MAHPIYMDHHATTPMDPRVVQAVMPYLQDRFGNPSSTGHVFGRQAMKAVEKARHQVARLIGAHPEEILFTSGATESNNLALLGIMGGGPPGRRLITCQTEHISVLEVARLLERQGTRVTYLPVDHDGLLDPDRLRQALPGGPALVSVMRANNEIGTLHPLRKVGAACREFGALLHTDAAQAVGQIPVDVLDLGVDLLSLSGHKLHGPKGVGALYLRSGSRQPLRPLFSGGGQEQGRRPGTLNVPGIVGLGEACRLARQEMQANGLRVRRLRDRLQAALLARLESVTVNGHIRERLPGNLNLSFANVEGEALMLAMPDLAVSTGSACASGRNEPSRVLLALGKDAASARGAIRFGLGRFNTEEEVDRAVEIVVQAVTRLRDLSPFSLGDAAGSPPQGNSASRR